MGKILNGLPEPHVKSTHCVFHDLMSCIIEQQIHYRSTKKIFEKMLLKSNLKLLTPDHYVTFEKHAFETIKLSLKKTETILHVLDYWSKNDINWDQLSDDEVRKKLSDIKGIGGWTIDMILMYTLKRPDVFAYDDYHIKQIMTTMYNLNPKPMLKSQMKAIAELWSPYKSIAFRYLLTYKDFLRSSVNNGSKTDS